MRRQLLAGMVAAKIRSENSYQALVKVAKERRSYYLLVGVPFCNFLKLLTAHIGGWGGSYWFSQATSSATNRSKLNNALVAAVNSFGLDGS
jgi:GH18 family chitinase